MHGSKRRRLDQHQSDPQASKHVGKHTDKKSGYEDVRLKWENALYHHQFLNWLCEAMVSRMNWEHETKCLYASCKHVRALGFERAECWRWIHERQYNWVGRVEIESNAYQQKEIFLLIQNDRSIDIDYILDLMRKVVEKAGFGLYVIKHSEQEICVMLRSGARIPSLFELVKRRFGKNMLSWEVLYLLPRDVVERLYRLKVK